MDSTGLNAGEFFKVVGCESVFHETCCTLCCHVAEVVAGVKLDLMGKGGGHDGSGLAGG